MSQTILPIKTPTYRGIDVLAVGFSTAVAMWIVGYVTHMPLIVAPGSVVFVMLLATLLIGGALFGRYGTRGIGSVVAAAMVTAVINLLVLGALLEAMSEGGPSPLIWVPGYFVATVVIMTVGWLIGRCVKVDRFVNWPLVFGWSAVAATMLVVSAGGLVTGFQAGFSVPDWPNTYGSNMFLFPLSRMTGGIYYEHTHRMAGALVGLTGMTLMIWLWLGGWSGQIKWFATVLFVLVCLQGVAGGIWVVRVDPADAAAMANAIEMPDGTFVAAPKLIYVMFHGTMGQLILGLFAVLAAMMSVTWQKRDVVTVDAGAATDRAISVMLFVALLVQLMLGVYARKTTGGLLMHITFAVIVSVLAVGASVRAASLWGDRHRILKQVGVAVGVVVMLQLCLGVLALIFRTGDKPTQVVVGSDAVAGATDAIFTTMHQSTGAVLLATATLLLAWNFRLLKPPAMGPKQPPQSL